LLYDWVAASFCTLFYLFYLLCSARSFILLLIYTVEIG
jgi:hypothetical protein